MKRIITSIAVSFFALLMIAGCSDSKKQITKLEDLKGVSIGAMTGTTGEQLAKERFPEATVKSFDDIMDAVAALKSGQIDAVITGFPAATNVCKHNQDLDLISEPVDFESTSVAVRKGSGKLLTDLNKIIAELHSNGTLKDMSRRWLKRDLSPYEEVEIKLPTKGEILKIGTSATREPFCFVDAKRNVTGHDGELARRIGAMLGRPIEFVDMKFSALIPALKSKKVDMIVAGMTATEERKKSVDFSEPYFQNSQVIIVKKVADEKPVEENKILKLKSVDDVKDKRVGVLLGSTHDNYAMKNLPKATVLQYKSPSELILAVRSGKVDAAMYTYETLQEILRADKDLEIFGDTLFTSPIAMGFNKTNDALREKFNTFLKKIKGDGTFKNMVDRWIVKGETNMPEIKNPKTNGTLIVGTVSDKGLPFTIVKDGKMIGFDMELAQRFAAYLGKELKLADMEFGSLIAAVSTNKIEMIASTLMITEERAKQIDFSDPYMRLGASLFALKKNIEHVKKGKLKNINDIANRRIGVYEGTINDAFVTEKYPDAEIKRFDNSADMFLSLKTKKIDVAFIDQISAKLYLKSESELGVLSDKVFEKPLGIGFNKNNPDLRKKFNEFLRTIKTDGSFDKMYKRWCVDDPGKAILSRLKVSQNSPVIKLGVTAIEDLPYVAFIEGKFVGLDIELLQKFAENIGKRLEIVTMDFPALLAALNSGKVDMIADGLTITEEREKQIDFSDSYLDYKAAVIARKDDIEIASAPARFWKLKTLYDIADKRVGVYAGTIYDAFVQKHFPKADAKQFTTVADMIIAMKTDKIDAAFFDMTSAKVVMESNPELGLVTDDVLEFPIGYGFNKNNQALRQNFNKFLKEIKADGTFDVIYKRWFVDNPQHAKMPKIEMDKSGKPLTLGITAGDLPNSAIINNEHVGFDIEMLKTFAKRKGYNMKIQTMEFSSLIAALAAGKVDIIAGGISITDERKKQIDFSDAYMRVKSALLALKKNIYYDNAKSGKLKTLGDIANKRVGVYAGSIHDAFVQKHFPNAEAKQFTTVADMILALKTNKIDAALFDETGGKVLMKSNPEIGIVTNEVIDLPVGYGFNSKNSALREKFNNFLKTTKADGTYDVIYKRWFVDDPEKAQMPEIEFDKNSKPLTLGVAVGDLPNSAIINNEHVGFDIEMLKTFAKREGFNMKIVTMEFSSLIAALAAGKVDIIADGISITEEREKQIDFSDPYNIVKSVVLALNTNIYSDNTKSKKLKVLDDIADKKVGVYEGTVHDGFVAKKYPQAGISRYNSSADMILSLKTGKIDVAMLDLITAKLLLKANPDVGILTENALSMPLGIGFNKKNPELKKQFNEFLSTLKSNGSFDEIYKRWCVEDAENAVMPEHKFSKNSPVLKVAVAVEDLPYVAYMKGKYVGIDIELLQKFAEYKGYQLKIMQMEFPSLVAALASGKVDIISDGIAITEERQKQIDFSDSYMDFKTAVIALNENLAGSENIANNTEEESKEPSAFISFFSGIAESFHNNIIIENRYLLIIDGLETTAIISILSIIFGTFLGGLICFMRMSKNKFLLSFSKVYISILRGTPVLVLLMIIFYVVFASIDIDPVVVAVIAFGLNFAAYVSEMYRTGIEGVDRGQTEAGIAMGFTKITTFIYIIMPQAARRILPVYKGEVISLVKMTSIVGYIAVQDLTKASDIIRSRTFDAFFPLIMVAVLYFIISWLLMVLLGYIERKTNPKLKTKRG
jgi:polar amino acid transport system substrate-binding protein